MTQRDPSEFNWNDLRHFLLVVRLGNPTRAARALGVDHTTVRRRVQSLEAELQTILFDRHDDRYVLTPQGQLLLDRAEAVESALIAARHEIAGTGGQLSGTVRIGVPDGFGSYFLGPRLTRLQAQHPQLRIELAAVSRNLSVSKREADIAIVISRPTESRHIMRKLIDCTLNLYGAPEYLEAHRPIRAVEDLSGHRFIGYTDEIDFNPALDPDLPAYAQLANPGFASTNLVAQYKATLAGGGLCLLPRFMLDLEGQRLRAVLPEQIRVVREHWLLVHGEMHELARIRATTAFIIEEVTRERMLFS